MDKKILIVITTAFVPYGGLATVMMNYYRAMDKTGLLIDFASTNDPPKVLLDELRANGSDYFNLGDRKKQLLKYLKNLKAVLTNGHYDVIHVNGNSTTMAFELMIAKKCRVSVRIAHGHTTQTDHAVLNDLLKDIFKKVYTYAVAVSSKAGNWLYDGGKYGILKNAINVEKYKYNKTVRKQIRFALNIEDKCVIGHLGKIYEPKNHDFLIDIFYEIKKLNNNTCLLLVGDGELKDNIKSKCERLKLEDVIFTGMVSNVYDYLQAMDVFVFPSLWEGSPLALIEAQTSGLPCIVSSNVTKDAKCTDNVIFMDLAERAEAWAKKAVEVSENLPDRTDVIDEIRRSGYDIQTEAKKLRMIYLNERK